MSDRGISGCPPPGKSVEKGRIGRELSSYGSIARTVMAIRRELVRHLDLSEHGAQSGRPRLLSVLAILDLVSEYLYSRAQTEWKFSSCAQYQVQVWRAQLTSLWRSLELLEQFVPRLSLSWTGTDAHISDFRRLLPDITTQSCCKRLPMGMSQGKSVRS